MANAQRTCTGSDRSCCVDEGMDCLVNKLNRVYGRALLLSIICYFRASSELLNWTGGGRTASILVRFARLRLPQAVPKQTSHTDKIRPAVSAQGKISTPLINYV